MNKRFIQFSKRLSFRLFWVRGAYRNPNFNIETVKMSKEYWSCNQQNSLTCMANSQATDTMAWGFDSGLIVVLNIRTCQILMRFRQNSAVMSLCFTQNDNLPPRLLSGGADGHLVSWDLKSAVFKCKKHLFDSGLSFIHFVATDQVSEVILCGSHHANGLRMLSYDEQELGDYRLLKTRQGLLGHVQQTRFLNDKHLMVRTDHVSGEIFNCWIWNDSASLRLSDKTSPNKVRNGVTEGVEIRENGQSRNFKRRTAIWRGTLGGCGFRA